MSSLQSNRHIPFTNSAQRQQQQQHLLHSQPPQGGQGVQGQQQSQPTGPGGFPQSLSGSETDISTSNENLSHEERYVIRHTARQEPQGQENMAMLSSSQSSPNSNRSSLSAKLEGAGMTGGNGSGSNRSSLNRPDNSSNRSSLDVSSSSYNTLIIHGTLDDSWPGRLSGIRDIQDQSGYGSFGSGGPQESPSPSSGSGNNSGKDLERDRDRSAQWYAPSLREIIDIPDDFLSQSQVLKHLAKEVKVYRSAGNVISRQSPDSNQRGHQAPTEPMKRLSLEHRGSGGPGPISTNIVSAKEEAPSTSQYTEWPAPPLPNHLKNGGIYPLERMALSRSQPDLSRIGEGKLLSAADIVGLANNRMASRDEDRTAPVEMVDMLIHENNFLRHELNECSQKVARSIKLEQEIQKVHRAQEELVASCERRERLERVARARLQSDCRRIQEVNRTLREQLEMLTASRNMSGSGSTVQSDQTASVEALKRDVGKREVLIAQLITQNKEFSAAKERQEIELAAQRVTLQEQRTHINILDTALQNAQSNVVRLEEECRKKQLYVERVAQLQRVLSSLQLASDRREQGERKLRMQLERELRNERARASGGAGTEDLGANGSETTAELKRKLREREGKIMLLEGEVAKWEQRYLEESSLRQAAIDAASLPKDAKIAALEKTSQETEKLIAEARTEKIRHMDEVHAAQKRVTDLESRLKDLESKLAERDAMIRVLQKHTCKDSKASSSSSYPISLGRSPHHTPHPSLNADLGVLGCSVSREEIGPVYSSSSPAFNSSNQSYSSSVGDGGYHHSASGSFSKFGTSQSFDQTKKSLDDELKELDSQLDSQLDSKMLSKDSLIQVLRREKEKCPSHYWQV